MLRVLLVGTMLLAIGIAAIGCDDDDETNGNGQPVVTSTPVAQPTEPADDGSPTAPAGTPTEGLGSELPQDVIDAVEAYVVGGSIPSFPPVQSIEPADSCTTAGQVCYDADESSFSEAEATVRVYSYASDDIQDVSLALEGETWNVTGHEEAAD